MTINYSKWDRLECSDDDESDNENTPRVTRLEEPSRVTLSHGSVQLEPMANTSTDTKSQTAVQQSQKPIITRTDSNISSSRARDDKTILDTKVKALTMNGGSYFDPTSQTQMYWSQDRYEAILSIEYESSLITSRSIHISTTGVLKYSDRNMAVGGTTQSKGTLNVSIDGNNTPLFSGEFAYFVHFAQDENDEGIDWEIVDFHGTKKLIRITLLKAVPMVGITIWWRSPFIHFPEINVEKDIPCRLKQQQQQQQQQHESNSNTSTNSDFQSVWEEAHVKFREKIQKQS